MLQSQKEVSGFEDISAISGFCYGMGEEAKVVTSGISLFVIINKTDSSTAL